MAETKVEARAVFDDFIGAYVLKYQKAAECLAKDREPLLAFYDFPAEHWKHLRTLSPIESTFATVRHRTIRGDAQGHPCERGSCSEVRFGKPLPSSHFSCRLSLGALLAEGRRTPTFRC